MTKGRSLELYFIDGNPEGMLTAEVFNWTGHVLVFPRTQIVEALQRPEASYTGIYLLIGENDAGPLAYIGEGEDISARIRSHDSKRDWWTKAYLVTTSANALNKAHVKYLEARLVEEALAVGRMPLENGNSPARPGLSEAARSNMEAFLDYLLMVLPAVGVDMFVRRTRAPKKLPAVNGGTAGLSWQVVSASHDKAPTEEPIFETKLPSYGIQATAVLREGEFVVLKGSLARHTWVGKEHHTYRERFHELVRAGVLAEQGEHRVFTTDYAFSSPSAAGAAVTGRSCNGQLAWKLQGSETTYYDWEQSQLAAKGKEGV